MAAKPPFWRLMRLLLCALLASWVNPSKGQILQLEDQRVTMDNRIALLGAFFVYSKEEVFGFSSSAGMRWWLPQITTAHVQFSGFRFLRADKTPIPNYSSVEISLIEALAFDNEKHSMVCCSERNHHMPYCPQLYKLRRYNPYFAYHHPIPSLMEGQTPPASEPIPLNTTGLYYLFVSNCKDIVEAVVNGTVTVRNAYGYLPANRFRRMDFYYGLLLTFVTLWVIWTTIMVKERHNLIRFHFLVNAILILGFIDAASQFGYLISWNHTGTRIPSMLALTVLSSVLLNGSCFTLILVASLGWGVTKPTLEPHIVRRIQWLLVAFFIVESLRSILQETDQYDAFSPFTIVLTLLPSGLLYTILTYWIVISLLDLLLELEHNRQYEKLQLFQKFLIGLLITVVGGILSLIAENALFAWPIGKRWKVVWIFEDVAPNLLFLSLLVFIMYLWKPNRKSRRLAYFSELHAAEELDDLDIWSEKLGYDESEDDLFTTVRNPTDVKLNMMAPSASIGRVYGTSTPTALPDTLKLKSKE